MPILIAGRRTRWSPESDRVPVLNRQPSKRAGFMMNALTEMDRRILTGLGAAVTLAPGFSLRTLQAAGSSRPALTTVNHDFLVSARQVRDWHAVKDSKGGPTLAGSPSWNNYLELLEKELRQSGAVDVVRHPFSYTRWHTTEWPDDSNWSLRVDGKKIKVASYGANSGATPDAGATADLVLYREGMPADALRGKIAVIVKPGPDTLPPMTGDYEYFSNADTFTDPAAPASELLAVNPFRLMGLTTAQAPLIAAGAVGAIIVMPFSYDIVAGLYTFGVPEIHQMPTLYLDRDAGASVVDAAKAGKRATLRLIATTEQAETYQLFGYLPGKDYGTPNDSQVLLVTHTDGPSISQENGALGILSIVRYFSRVPQAERPRTLMVFLDCRHYMPGAERAFAQQDYVVTQPDLYKRVIASMGIEHLGQIKVEEGHGQPLHKTNLPELHQSGSTNNQKLIDLAVHAVKDNGLSRVQVQCPDRPGTHGKSQLPWYGLGSIANRLKIPGYGAMGLLSAYWTTRARLDYLDANHFVTQIATLSQICGGLMTADIAEIRTA